MISTPSKQRTKVKNSKDLPVYKANPEKYNTIVGMNIFIRKESLTNETRVPIVPEDVHKLILAEHTVILQKSNTRVFTDEEFLKAGAKLTDDEWHKSKDALIIGLKELDNLEKLNAHTHVYFSHSYKNQQGSQAILQAFNQTNSILYDLEYFTNNDGSRLLAFGYFAGLIGAVLGLRQNYNKNMGIPDIHDLTPWASTKDLLYFCKIFPASIAVIGNGRSAKGVKDMLNRVRVPYSNIDRHTPLNLGDYDMIFNCILLDESYDKTWITKDTNLEKPLLIIDISCDYSKSNNPIAIYNKPTTWKNPVYNFNDKISIIAIDNLPSLLPRDACTDFSNGLTELLLNIESPCWQRNLEKFREVTIRLKNNTC